MKKVVLKILEWLFCIGMIVWSLFLSFAAIVGAAFASDAGTPKPGDSLYFIYILMWCFIIGFPVLSVAGTILGNLKSRKFYWLFLPSIIIPIIFYAILIIDSFLQGEI